MRSVDSILDSPSITDLFAWTYSFSGSSSPTADAGRVRPPELFDRMYGDCRRGAVEKNLVGVRWVRGGYVRVTRVNGVARQLDRVARDLEKLGPDIGKYTMSIGGTYNCRPIANTRRFSAHSYGFAIDLNVEFGDYWLWSKNGKFRNRIPMDIVAVFERHGFIWGGRWAHFDTMHFEYRPEIIAAADSGAGLRATSRR